MLITFHSTHTALNRYILYRNSKDFSCLASNEPGMGFVARYGMATHCVSVGVFTQKTQKRTCLT